MNKKLFSMLLMMIMVITSCFCAFANEGYIVSEKGITVTYNGDDVVFPDAEPLIQDERTLVPARAIMERAKLDVSFDSASRIVSAKKDDFSITMPIDSTKATVTKCNETRTVELDVPARIIDDRTYVPVRFIAESLGTKVNWNPNYREVVIIDTAEWKAEIEEKSDFLAMTLNLPVTQPAQSCDTAGSFNFSTTILNALVPQSAVKTNFSIQYIATEVFDGKNTGSNQIIEIDLQDLAKAATTQADKEMMEAYAKKHVIDLDTIVDQDYNLYIKSNYITSLLRDFGEEKIADKIENKYVKVPLNDLLALFLQTPIDVKELINKSETVGDLFENFIMADDVLYSTSVAMIDEYISNYTALYANQFIKRTKLADGSVRWTYAINQDDYIKAMNNTELTEDMAMKMATNFEMIIKNNIATKTEVKSSQTVTSKNILHPEEETTITQNSSVSSVARAFNKNRDKAIQIPQNVISLDDILGFSLSEYLNLLLIG